MTASLGFCKASRDFYMSSETLKIILNDFIIYNKHEFMDFHDSGCKDIICNES